MPRKFKRLAALAKIEATYGTDSAPTAAANALELSNVTLTPMEGDQVSRDLIRPYYGDLGSVQVASYARVEFDIEMAGSGTAGTVPAYGVLLRACGLAEVVTANTKVEYLPASASAEACTLHFFMDGVRHVLLGSRGTLTLSQVPRQIPKFRFTLSGLLGTITDAATPAAPNYGGFKKPLVCSKENTSFSIHGLAAVLESLSVDLGNQVEPRMLIGSESIEIVDRKVSGTAVIEAVLGAAKDWFAIAKAGTTGILLATHGKTAGGIVELEAPAVQIGKPTYGNTQGILNNSLPLMACPVTGDDELVIRVR